MLRVGLTGGLASGKSFVGRALADLGCRLLEADELGRAAIEPNGEAYAQVVAEFGPEILDPDGRINRRRLAALVFDDPDRLERLNALIHPVVIRRQQEWIAQIGRSDPSAIAVVEAAILIETGSYRRFDRIILAACRPDQQVERAVARGMSRQEALARLRRQMPLEAKRKYAHYVIDTSGTREQTLQQVREVYHCLRETMR